MRLLRLNIGGSPFYILERAIRLFPSSKLARFLDMKHDERVNNCDMYLDGSEQYFFDRSAVLFEAVAHLYRSGAVTSRVHMCCNEALEAELAFWELPVSLSSHACQAAVVANGTVPEPRKSFLINDDDSQWVITEDSYALKCCVGWRKKLWLFLEDPFSTPLAMIYAVITISFVLLTIFVLMVDSLPEYRAMHCDLGNGTNYTRGAHMLFGPIPTTVPCVVHFAILDIIDCLCVVWFTIDFLLRILAAPQLLKFLRSPLNIIDFAAILPFYVEFVIDYVASTDSRNTSTNIRRAIMALRAFRIGRVVQLARYSSGLKALAIALRQSIKELTLLFMFIVLLVTFLATIVFYFESDQRDTMFTSIPAAAWWSLITVTTIGYGDMVPVTVAGKIVGSCTALLGIVVLAFPVSIIVDNCRKAYDEMLVREKRRAERICKQHGLD